MIVDLFVRNWRFVDEQDKAINNDSNRFASAGRHGPSGTS